MRSLNPPMVVALGDLVEDIVVELDEPINAASDTSSRITRRRGGSAANVAATAAAQGTRSRFLGQVGADAIGTALIGELDALGVDVSHIRRGGSTGTIVALVDATGERSMLTDRRACTDLQDPEPRWIDGATTLHVPLYSLVGGATAATATTVIGWAHDHGILVSIDVSSSSVIRDVGVGAVLALLAELAPDVVFANLDEATALGITAPVGTAMTIVKRGARSTIIHTPGRSTAEIAVSDVVEGVDTTGAGDAFAAGFLGTSEWTDEPIIATVAGHTAAARLLGGRVTTLGR